jgi:hypothetical protein
MLNKLIIHSFILFLFIIITLHFYTGGSILEGLDSPSPSPSPSPSDIGVTVGTYSAKLDALEKTVDSIQSNVLGLLPIVTNNTSGNAKNEKAIQAIIANQSKT